MPRLLVPRESMDGETRVAATPDTVRKLIKLGFEVVVEAQAGAGASFLDGAYAATGAVIEQVGPTEADVVLRVQPPTTQEAEAMREGALLVGFLWPEVHRDAAEMLVRRKATAFAMEAIPRITRAQPMDALSSQSNIAGYKAALLAASTAPKLFPMLMTAAGTIMPARVMVMGAGVAGLQAIATARRLGAVVEVTDVRRAVKEQVESLGARFIEVEGAEDLEGEGGYAREASVELLERQRREIERHLAAADVVITTALVPGRPAPVLITASMVERMKPGAVIVDMAVEQGGNCELSRRDESVERHGVRILGPTNLPALIPVHASDMYARNVLAVVEHLYDSEDNLRIDFEDEITAGAVVIHQGEVRGKRTGSGTNPGAKEEQ